MGKASRLQTLKPRLQTLGGKRSPSSLGIRVLTRGTSAQRGYGYRWRKFRDAWIAAHPLCGDRLNGPSPEHSVCVREGRTTAAQDVDHVARMTGPDDPRFFDETNVQSLCVHCHRLKDAGHRPGGAG
jgi:5-methylcytosine-specific restriction protein A